MVNIKRLRNAIFLTLLMNGYALINLINSHWLINTMFYTFGLIFFILINIKSCYEKKVIPRLRIMIGGYELNILFVVTFTINIIVNTLFGVVLIPKYLNYADLIINIVLIMIFESILILNGTLRFYFTSIQLGIKWRIVIFLFWWVPIFNIFLIIKVCDIIHNEFELEKEKLELNDVRKESEICKTKYPLLLVHGVFFRDIKHFNYWGRTPKELLRNGTTIYYGEQQSAASVEKSGEELAEKIKQIISETGCEKVNIIAHSKGGLDSRYAISCLGMDKYVASLTTINTPHRGCAFAEYLLNKAPNCLCNHIAKRYNSALKKLGDSDPDFISAVQGLTVKSCLALNENAIDKEGVFYQSVATKMNKSSSGKFPLNLSYNLVRKFDGENDGLVSIKSAKWGENCRSIIVKGKRGLSHADIIDLNREDIKEFDIREFYVEIVRDMKGKML